MHAPTATAIAAILGEPVVAMAHENGIHYRAENGNGFMLLTESRTTAEHIAECLIDEG